MLAHAADVMGAPRVILTWEDREEPWLNIALCEEQADDPWSGRVRRVLSAPRSGPQRGVVPVS